MKKTLLALLVTTAATIAQARVVQTIFTERALFRGEHCTLDTLEDVQAQVEFNAQKKCDGELTRKSEWLKITEKPVFSFCYPAHVLAVFECLSNVE